MAFVEPSVKLYTGVQMPLLGLGTYQMRGAVCVAAVEHALRAGYRLLDTAQVYKNEADVGAGLRASGVARDAIFIVSKLEPKAQGAGAYDACCRSLEALGVTYIDMFLIHWPGVAGCKPADPSQAATRQQSWLCLQRLVTEGKARAIGVSSEWGGKGGAAEGWARCAAGAWAGWCAERHGRLGSYGCTAPPPPMRPPA